MRRNVDLKIILHNNEIYGLTKGQYSPTSAFGKVTKSSPMGPIDTPLNPLAVALGAEATFVARSLDTDTSISSTRSSRAGQPPGHSFVEIYQNCNIFNDGAFEDFTAKDVRADRMLFLEHGEPMIFGKNRDKGIRLNGLKPEVVDRPGRHHREGHPGPRRDASKPDHRLHALAHGLPGLPGAGRRPSRRQPPHLRSAPGGTIDGRRGQVRSRRP